MALKLEEFRLETYEERHVIGIALEILRSEQYYRDHYGASIDALMTRIARTQCQPGGCSYCGGPQDDWND